MKYYSANEHYMFYYHKDYLDNIREVYVHPEPNYIDIYYRQITTQAGYRQGQ